MKKFILSLIIPLLLIGSVAFAQTDIYGRRVAISDEAYGATWNGVDRTAPSKNAVYDKIESLGAAFDPAIPGPIGGTTPGAGTFTTLTATGALNTAYATVASHATTSAIWAAAGNVINFTGNETITALPAAPQAGAQRILICAGTPTFTHAGAITVQGGVSYTAAAGDLVVVTATTTTAFKVSILKQSGLPTVLQTTITGNAGTATTLVDSPTLTGTANIGTTAAGGNLNVVATLGTESVESTLTSANWTMTGGWTIAAGVLANSGTAGTATAGASAMTAPTAGVTYKVVIVCSAYSAGTGGVTYTVGGVSGTAITATTITDYITASSTARIIFTSTGSATASITSVSVKPLTDATGDLTVDGNIVARSQILADPIGPSTTYPAYSFAGDTDTGIGHSAANSLDFIIGGANISSLSSTGLSLGASKRLEWGQSNNLYGEASAVVAQRSVTTQQIFRLYNTADAAGTFTNYERLTLTGVQGASVDIKAETAGSGGDNLDVVITPAGTGTVKAAGAALNPVAVNTTALGTTALPFTSIFIGDAATNNVQLINTAAASAVVLTLPDTTGTIPVGPTTTTAGKLFQGTTTVGLGAWSTPTYPSASGTLGQILVSDGTNNVYSTGFTVDADGDVIAKSYSSTQTTVGQYLSLLEGSGGGTNFRKWLVPDALTADLTFLYPDTVPTVGQVMSWSAPSTNVSTGSFVTPILGTYGSTANALGKRGADATTVAASTVTEDGTTLNAQGLNIVTTGTVEGKIPIIDGGAADLTLTTAQVSGKIISNTGQGVNDRNHTLPVAIAGLSFIGVVGEAQAAKYYRFTANTSPTPDDFMCLDGTCGKTYVSIAAPTQGAQVTCYTAQIASTGLKTATALSIGTTVQNVKNTAFTFDISGTGYAGTLLDAGTAPAVATTVTNRWGAQFFEVGVDSVVAPIAGTSIAAGFATEAEAIAEIVAQSATASHTKIGYVTLMRTNVAGFVWGTTSLADAETTVNYYNTAAYTKPYNWICNKTTGLWVTN